MNKDWFISHLSWLHPLGVDPSEKLPWEQDEHDDFLSVGCHIVAPWSIKSGGVTATQSTTGVQLWPLERSSNKNLLATDSYKIKHRAHGRMPALQAQLKSRPWCFFSPGAQINQSISLLIISVLWRRKKVWHRLTISWLGFNTEHVDILCQRCNTSQEDIRSS